MATPARKLILDDIKTTLEAITVAGGYKTTVVTVERVIRDWGDVSAAQRPWVGFAPRIEAFQFLPGKQVRVKMPVLIIAHISKADVDTKHAALSDLHDDIVAALGVDPTRAGNAVNTIVLQTEDDTGDPDTVDSTGRSGTLEVTAEVTYMRTYAST